MSKEIQQLCLYFNQSIPVGMSCQMPQVLQLTRRVHFLSVGATMLTHTNPYLHDGVDLDDEHHLSIVQPTKMQINN